MAQPDLPGKDSILHAEDLIRRLYDDVQTLYLRQGEGWARRVLLAQIFRQAHSLKGTAQALGWSALSELAHDFEAVLDGLQLGRYPLDEGLLGLLERSVAASARALNSRARGLPEPSYPSRLAAQLRQYVGPSAATPVVSIADYGVAPPSAGLPIPEEIQQSLSLYEKQRLREALAEGLHVHLLQILFAVTDFAEPLRRLTENLAHLGEVIATQPLLAENPATHIAFRLLCAMSPGQSLPDENLHHHSGTLSWRWLNPPASPLTDTFCEPASSGSGTMRVAVREIDEIITHARQLTAKLTPSRLSDASLGQSVHAGLEGLTERLLTLRAQAVGRLFARVAEAGQRAAHNVGKEIGVEIAGGTLLLDKSVCDQLFDPLLQLMRNAVGHGLEDSATRRAQGKPSTGCVRLAANKYGTDVSISISDDGRGLDYEAIARHARARNLSETVTKPEQLIFQVGFTTSAEVSELSGRGIGLDIVRRNLDTLGAKIAVASQPGQGTTFTITLPQTPSGAGQ